MALIVEDGTGLANAESYISEADATAYWASRLNDAWANATAPQREASLRNAADYLSYVYGWPGQPSTTTQRLSWPRAGVPSGAATFPSTAIPQQIIDAQLFLALSDLSSPILIKPVADPRALLKQTTTVGKVSTSKEWAASSVDQTSGLQRFPMVDIILNGVAIIPSSGSISVVPLVRA
jgi:hypothetical protein